MLEWNEVFTYPGAPYRLSETPWKISRRAPLIGENNIEIYIKELAYDMKYMEYLKQTGII